MGKNTTDTKNKYIHLSFAEREEISIGLSNNKRIIDIAKSIGRNASTIYREASRNNAQVNTVQYRANRAQLRCDERKVESHSRERLSNRVVRKHVIAKLKEEWTPELIVCKLLEDKPGYKTNHESIYRWIYSDRRELIKYLTRVLQNRVVAYSSPELIATSFLDAKQFSSLAQQYLWSRVRL
ncbi:MAG: helix-turn-helix domain-containing protein [Spirochaetia bacterium]|jgi:IS30 family transposase|nr:helix-turn-helix domain-containing protein [Spirochaetia bacterium]